MSALYAIRCFYGGSAKVMLPFLVVSGYAFVETSYAVIAERSIGDVPDAFVANWTVAKTPPPLGHSHAASSRSASTNQPAIWGLGWLSGSISCAVSTQAAPSLRTARRRTQI